MAWSETEKSRVRELFDAGKSHKEIARAVQRSVRSIDRICRRMKLRRHNPHAMPIVAYRGLGTMPLSRNLIIPLAGHCHWFQDGKFCGKPSDMPSGWCDVHSWAAYGK